MDRIEKIKELLNSLSSEYLIAAWNERCSDEDMDDYIYDNGEYFFEEMFEKKVDDAVRAVCYGDYHYNHSYVVFNGYGNLDSFEFADEDNCPIDIDSLADWIDKNDGCDVISEEDGYDEIFNNEENNNE